MFLDIKQTNNHFLVAAPLPPVYLGVELKTQLSISSVTCSAVISHCN